MLASRLPSTVNSGVFFFLESTNWRYVHKTTNFPCYNLFYVIIKVYADGYVPKEVEFMVVDEHPTLLNVTLHPAKVGLVSHADV